MVFLAHESRPKLQTANHEQPMKTDRMNPEFQRQTSKIVGSNVILNVNEIISALIETGYIDEDTSYDLACDDEENEVLEYWHVTSWLARQLEKEGEKVVLLEDLNLIVWCRTTSGQAISMDSCLETITERVLNEA